MSKPIDAKHIQTADKIVASWYEHMKRVLSLEPMNWGMIILIRNGGKTYRFVIKGPITVTYRPQP
jgi:uncharacterized protein (UPF0264 family)